MTLFLPKVIKLGAGSLQELGEMAIELQASHLFVVSGSLLTKDPFKTQFNEIVRKHSLNVTISNDFNGEPTTDHLRKALDEINRCKADCVVGLGGGRVIDLAKAVSVLALNKNMDLDDIGITKNLERLPLIAIPTTAGTGSEASKVTVITDSKTNIKKNPAHPQLIPDISILDPELTLSLPKNVTAYTGLDALAHAMEAYVSTRATPMSDHYALEAMRMIGEYLPKAYMNGNNLEIREKMLLASCYAGIAFSNASTNLAHAMARPLGARFHIPHGLSVALLLPFVMEFGLEVAESRYAEVARALGCKTNGGHSNLGKKAIEVVREYNTTFHIWKDGFSYIDGRQFEDILPFMIKDALSGNGVVTNRKIPDEKDVEKLYRDLAYELQSNSALHTKRY